MIVMQKKVRTNIQICVTCTILKIFDNYWSINYVKKKEIKQNIEMTKVLQYDYNLLIWCCERDRIE
jgi:hypothetical protein